MNRRTSLVTAAAVAGTILAGSAAIAANIGVLSAAEDDSIGKLSAEATVASPPASAEPQVVDIYLEDLQTPPTGVTSSTTTTVAATDFATQEFAVEGAGTVTVHQDPAGVRVSKVDANAGWLWKTEQSSPTELVVIFASSDTIYEFHASVDDNGVVDARVDEPIVNVVQVPGPTPAPPPSGGAGGQGAGPATSAAGYDDDDDEYEYDDESDDHDEYEGSDDDD